MAHTGKVVRPDADTLNVLPGGALKANGTQASHVADAKVDYTTGDLDAESEVIAAFNTTNGKVNAILAALEGVGILKTS